MTRTLRSALGFALGLLVKLYLATLRVSLHVDPSLDHDDPRPWILCFWHGDQFPLLSWKRRRPTVALVSHSADGQIQAQALRRQGLSVERGSTSRGGARGLIAIVRRLEQGHHAAFALDGPKGPRFTVASGARLAARLTGGVLVPMGSASSRGISLEKAWDKFRIPFPFTKVAVRLGPPVSADVSNEELGRAVTHASALASGDVGMIGSHQNAVLRHARRA